MNLEAYSCLSWHWLPSAGLRCVQAGSILLKQLALSRQTRHESWGETMEGCSDGETPQESKSSADKCMWSWATVLSVSMMSLVMMSVNTLIIFTMYYSTVLFFTRGEKKEIPLSVLPKTQQFQSVYSLTPISDISGRYSDYGTDWPQTTTAQEGFHFQAIPGLMRFKKNIFWNSFSLDCSLI